MILRAILMVILSISAVRCQQGLTPGGTHDALSVGRQGSSPSSSSRSTLVNDIRGALSSALDTGRLGSLGGSSSSTQNGVQQEPLPGFGSTDQLRSSPGGFPQTVVEAQPGQGSFSGGTTDQFGGFDTSNQDFGFGGRSENMPPRTQDSTGGGSFLTSAGRSGTGIGTLPSGSDISTGSSGFTFGASGTTGTLPGPGTGTQTGQGQSFGFGAPPSGFGSQMGPGFTFGASGTTGTLPSSGTGAQTGQGQSFGFGAPSTGFGSQGGPAFSFSPPMDSGPQTPTGGFGMPPTGGAGMGAMTGMTGTFGIRPPSGAGVTGGSMGVTGGNMTPPGAGMFMPQGPGSFMMQPPSPGMGAFTSRMSSAGPMFGPGSIGGGTPGAELSPGSGGMQGLPRGISFPGMSLSSGMTFPMPGTTFPGVPGSSGSTTAGSGASSRFFSPFPGMGPTGGFDQSLAIPGASGFFITPGFPPGMIGGQQAGTGMFGMPTSTGSGTAEWQTSGAMSSGLPTSPIPTGAFFPGMTAPGSFGLPATGTSGAGSSFQMTGSGTSTGGGTDASSGTFPGMTFVSGTGGPILPPGFFVPGGGQASGGGGSSGREGFFPDSTRTGSGVNGLAGGPFGDFSSSQGFDPRMMPSGGPGQFMTFGAGPIFTRRGRMPMDFFIRRR